MTAGSRTRLPINNDGSSVEKVQTCDSENETGTIPAPQALERKNEFELILTIVVKIIETLL